LSHTTSFTNTLADNSQTVQELIDNLNTVVGTSTRRAPSSPEPSTAFRSWSARFSQDRDTIGTAITALDNGTASIADLLVRARPALAGTVDQLNRMAPLLGQGKNLIDISLQKLPNNYRKLRRLGSYGAWFPYYLCGLALRVSDLAVPDGGSGHKPPGHRKGVRNPMLKYRGADSFGPDSSALCWWR